MPELSNSIDSNPNNTKWVMYGASGTYMIGDFDGKSFTPESGKHLYTRGALYAAQTFSNMPDGRRVQIGWGKISHPGMPFNGMMLLPTELTLKSTKNGPRLFNIPVTEATQSIHFYPHWQALTSDKANNELEKFRNIEGMRIKTTINLSHATSAGISLDGQKILDYDLNGNTVNGVFYSPEDMTSMELTADIYIDKTSVEVFIDNGAYNDQSNDSC